MIFSSIVPFMLLCILSAFFCTLWKTRIDYCLPFAVVGVIVVLYIFGLFGILLWGLGAICLLAAFGLGYMIVKRKSVNLRDIFTPGLLFVTLLFVFAFFFYCSDDIRSWDEGAHWILSSKNTFTLDQLGAHASANGYYKSYFPGVPLFLYFFTRTSGVFLVRLTYVGMNLFTSCLLAPIFAKFSFRDKWKLPLVFIVVFMLPFSVFSTTIITPYYSTLADNVLGLLFGCMLVVWHFRKGDAFAMIFCSMGLAGLILLKESGQFLSLCMLLLMLADLLCRKHKYKKTSGLSQTIRWKTILLIALAGVAIIFLCKFSWEAYYQSQGVPKTFGNSMGETLSNLLFDRSVFPAWGVEGFKRFYVALFTDTGVFSMSFFGVPYITWLFACMLLFALVFYFSRKNRLFLLNVSVLFVGNIVYVFGVSLLMLNTFSEGEVAGMSCVPRYSAVFLLGMLMLGVACLLACMREKNWKRGGYLCLSLCLLLSPSYGVLFSRDFALGVPHNLVHPLISPNTHTTSDYRIALDAECRALAAAPPDHSESYFLYMLSSSTMWYYDATLPLRQSGFEETNFDAPFAESAEYTRVYIAAGAVTEEFLQRYSERFVEPAQIYDRAIYAVVPTESGKKLHLLQRIDAQE